jgi:hypothetical protein
VRLGTDLEEDDLPVVVVTVLAAGVLGAGRRRGGVAQASGDLLLELDRAAPRPKLHHESSGQP